MAEKKECEKSQNIVDEASEKEKKERNNADGHVLAVSDYEPRRAVKKARLMRLPDCQPNWKL